MISLGTVVMRLGLALLLGLLIGMERERGERAAGMRTNGLVALGAALIMVVSIFGFADIQNATHISFDPSRIAAQVVSGIGFIGAGAILLRRDIVRGLTTAAAIWLVAGIGLACGAGLLLVAIITTALALVVLAALRPIERILFPRRTTHSIRLRLEPGVAAGTMLRAIHNMCAQTNIELDSVDMRTARDSPIVEVRCHVTDASNLIRAVGLLREMPGVRAVRADLRGADQRVWSNRRERGQQNGPGRTSGT